MLKYLIDNLKKRNIFLKYHAVTVILFTLIYYITTKYIIDSDNEYDNKYRELKNCVMLSINTQTGVAYGFTDLPKSNVIVTLIHLQIIISFLLLNI